MKKVMGIWTLNAVENYQMVLVGKVLIPINVLANPLLNVTEKLTANGMTLLDKKKNIRKN
jgi:hypothetical protein